MGARDHRLTRLRRRAAAVLWAEILATAAAPAFCILLVYAGIALFGLGNGWLFGAALLLAALALVIGLRRAARPDPAAIDARIEAASGLPHRPLAALEDAPEAGDDVAMAIWRAHQARSRAALQNARAGTLAPQAASRDPLALRALLLLLLLTGAVTAGAAIPSRLATGFALPAWPFAGPTVSAWVTPPAYTGQPPVVLTQGQAVSALTGSKLTIITNGPSAAPPVKLAGAAVPETLLGANSHRADGVLTQSGPLTVGPWWHRLAAWNVTVIPPAAPLISISKIDIKNGNILTLHWHVTDPYGLDRLGAIISAAGHPAALGLAFPLPNATGDGIAKLDLSASPFFNLPVTVTLAGRNEAGKSGSANWPANFVLPGLDLHDPTAIRLNQFRQDLALEPEYPRTVATPLQSTAKAPPSAISDSADVQIAVLACAIWLRQDRAPEAMHRLLAIVKEIEAGPDFVADQQLAQANQALTAQLERGLHGQMPTAAALQSLLRAMHDALARHLAALTPQSAPPPGGKEIDTTALDKLAQQIAADEAAGKTEQAAQELRQLEQVLNELQSARPMTAAQAAQAAAANAGSQAIAQMTKAEANLMDQTNNGSATPGEQGALQMRLEGVTQSLGQAGIQLPGLGPAKSAMGKAKSALGQQDTATAQAQENAAIQGLQQAAAALAKAQGGAMSIGQNGQPNPLPNPTQNFGLNGNADEDTDPNLNFGAANPASAIEQQIIKNDANPSLPPATHNYYHRLLDDGGL